LVYQKIITVKRQKLVSIGTVAAEIKAFGITILTLSKYTVTTQLQGESVYPKGVVLIE
jgi:hypothetical protein